MGVNFFVWGPAGVMACRDDGTLGGGGVTFEWGSELATMPYSLNQPPTPNSYEEV